jgi:hypothetical protein
MAVNRYTVRQWQLPDIQSHNGNNQVFFCTGCQYMSEVMIAPSCHIISREEDLLLDLWAFGSGPEKDM